MGHNHSHTNNGTTEKISVAFGLNLGFCILEFVGGYFTNSVAIMSDALHDLGDSLSLGLAWYFQKISARKRTKYFTYGYKRFSLLGAFINSMVLIIGSIFVLKESIQRISEPQSSNAKGMLILAIIGIIVNGWAVLKLRTGTSLNEKVISLHLLEDVLGWVAVLIGSFIMLYIDLPIIDPILSIGITCFVLLNVYKNLKSTFQVILQGIPRNVNGEEVRVSLLQVPGVKDIHDLHIWTMDDEYNILSVHVITNENAEIQKVKNVIKDMLKSLHIQHSTIEIETETENCELINC